MRCRYQHTLFLVLGLSSFSIATQSDFFSNFIPEDHITSVRRKDLIMKEDLFVTGELKTNTLTVVDGCGINEQLRVQGQLLLNGVSPAGQQGPQGPAGVVAGIQGVPGVQGARGEPGVQGAQGDPGVQGAQGNVGSRGAQGNTGAQGIQGVVGPQGPQGEVGSKGPDGLQGLEGVQGDQGLEGERGLQGPTGEQGDQGVPGIQGPEGNPGVQGPQGAQGPIGPQGVIGAGGILGCGYVYSTANNVTVANNTAVTFTLDGSISSTSVSATTAGFTVNVTGKFLINLFVSALLGDLSNIPVTVAIAVNGVTQNSSVFSTQTIGSTTYLRRPTGSVILTLNATDQITLVNKTGQSVILFGNTNISAAMSIIQVA